MAQFNIDTFIRLKLIPQDVHPAELDKLSEFMADWSSLDRFTQRKFAHQYHMLTRQWQRYLPVLSNSLLLGLLLSKFQGEDVQGFKRALALIADKVVMQLPLDGDLIEVLYALVQEGKDKVIEQSGEPAKSAVFDDLHVKTGSELSNESLQKSLQILFELLSQSDNTAYAVLSDRDNRAYFKLWSGRLADSLGKSGWAVLSNFSLEGKQMVLADLLFAARSDADHLLAQWDYSRMSLEDWRKVYLYTQNEGGEASKVMMLVILHFLGFSLQGYVLGNSEWIKTFSGYLSSVNALLQASIDKAEQLLERGEAQLCLNEYQQLHVVLNDYGSEDFRAFFFAEQLRQSVSALGKQIKKKLPDKTKNKTPADSEKPAELVKAVEQLLSGSPALSLLGHLLKNPHEGKDNKALSKVLLIAKDNKSDVRAKWRPDVYSAAILLTYEDFWQQLRLQGPIASLLQMGQFDAILAEQEQELPSSKISQLTKTLTTDLTLLGSPQSLAKKYCNNRFYHLLYGNEQANDDYPVVRNASSLSRAMAQVVLK